MKPLFDRLLIRKAKLEEVKTEAGIFLANEDLETAHERACIVSQGDDVKFVEPGQFIYLAKNSGSPILVGSETLYVIREMQIDLVE